MDALRLRCVVAPVKQASINRGLFYNRSNRMGKIVVKVSGERSSLICGLTLRKEDHNGKTNHNFNDSFLHDRNYGYICSGPGLGD